MNAKLLESREQLRSCLRDDCPSVVRKDCVRWLDEIQEQIPTVVLEALSERGAESDVKVYANGTLLTDQLAGASLELDPGAYEFRFEVTGQEPLTLRVMLKQGDHNRLVSADFRPPEQEDNPRGSQALPESSSRAAPPALPPGRPERPVPFLTYAFAGLALATGAASAYFGTQALSGKKDGLDGCAPVCSQSVADDVDRKALYADIAGGVAIGSAATAIIVFLARPTIYVEEAPPGVTKEKRTGAAAMSWSLAASPGDAKLGIVGSF